MKIVINSVLEYLAYIRRVEINFLLCKVKFKRKKYWMGDNFQKGWANTFKKAS